MVTENSASQAQNRQPTRSTESRYQYVIDLALQLPRDPALAQEFRDDPLHALVRHSVHPDEKRTAWVTVILGVISVLVLIAIIGFAMNKTSVPPELVALGSAALGGLVGTQARR